MARDPMDIKGLIFEAYRIEGITLGECRSIFLDWALSVPEGQDTQGAIAGLLANYQPGNPDHPMTQVLIEAQGVSAPPRRRGGWRSRPRDS